MSPECQLAKLFRDNARCLRVKRPFRHGPIARLFLSTSVAERLARPRFHRSLLEAADFRCARAQLDGCVIILDAVQISHESFQTHVRAHCNPQFRFVVLNTKQMVALSYARALFGRTQVQRRAVMNCSHQMGRGSRIPEHYQKRTWCTESVHFSPRLLHETRKVPGNGHSQH